MSLIAFDGFDHYVVSGTGDTLSNIISYGDTFSWRRGGFIRVGLPSPLIGSTSGRFGGGALYPGNTASTFTYGMLTTPIKEMITGFATFIQANNGGIGFTLTDQRANQAKITATLSHTGGLNVAQLSVGNTLIYTSGNIFNRNTWFYAELRIIIDGTSGIFVVNIDGVNKVSLSGLNTLAGTHDYWDQIAFGSTTNQEPVDDWYLEDSTVGPGPLPFNGFLGPVRAFTKYPIRTVSTQFTPLTSTNLSQVRDRQMDSDTSYNYSPPSGVGNTDLFIGTFLPRGSMPLAVRTQSAFKQDDTGSRSMANVMKSGAVTSIGTDSVVNQSYIYQTMGNDLYPYNPDGVVPWTKLSVDSTNFGYKMTG